MDSLQRIYMNRILKPWLKWRLKFTSSFRYKNLQLKIFPGVFHPRYFFSSRYLADFVSRLNMRERQFAEVCTGSGLISLIARLNGAHVTCSDIDSSAVRNAHWNQAHNAHLFPETGTWTLLESDLFSHYPEKRFDTIVVNPPYFFQPREQPEQLAWNCGENGEFFSAFFAQLPNYMHEKTEVYMVLAETCEVDRIRAIALKSELELQLIEERKIKWEKNYIFKIVLF